MLKSFHAFLIEQDINEINEMANFAGRGLNAARHAEKYFTPKSGEVLHKTLKRGHKDIPSGTKVGILGHEVDENGTYVAKVRHNGRSYRIPFTALDKPKQSEPDSAERITHENFNHTLEKIKQATGRDHVKIRLPHGETILATHMERVGGSGRKADFILHGKDGKKYYISHKKGNSFKDFQQLSGVSHEHFAKSKPVQELVKRAKVIVNKDGRLTGTIARKLNRSIPEDEDLLNKATFGHNHGEKDENGEPMPHGVDHVHAVIQGPMTLAPHPNGGYQIKANKIYMSHDRLPDSFEGEVVAKYSSDRNDLGVSATRITINPTGGRPVKYINEKK